VNSIPQPGEREPRQRPIPESLRALLESLIDYAELFPPAALDMKTAVRNYARYLECEHSWMLARFVVPVARLEEFELEQASLCSPGGPPAVPRAAPPARQIGREEELGAAPFPAGQGANQAAEAAG
jgi:hypothetical protein